jgi:alanine racemase/UDP-N-acetylmuramoyl-tripeptide--D-alanyl-D-alanine ligase
MVRVGLGLYGLYSTAAVEDAMRLELGIGVTSRIVRIIQLAAGETAGYNRAFTATRRTRLGVIPFGYDDGLPWSLSGKGYVLVAGLPAPIAGRISMDQMQIDITDLPGIGVGAEVLLYGTHNSHTLRPELVAEQAGTIGHELLTRLGPRVERIYLE